MNVLSIMEWAAVAAAAAAIAAAGGILWALWAGSRSLRRAASAADTLQSEASALLTELRAVSRETAEAAALVRRQLQRTERLFAAVETLGKAGTRAADTVQGIAAAAERAAERVAARGPGGGASRLEESLEWAERIWRVWQRRRAGGKAQRETAAET